MCVILTRNLNFFEHNQQFHFTSLKKIIHVKWKAVTKKLPNFFKNKMDCEVKSQSSIRSDDPTWCTTCDEIVHVFALQTNLLLVAYFGCICTFYDCLCCCFYRRHQFRPIWMWPDDNNGIIKHSHTQLWLFSSLIYLCLAEACYLVFCTFYRFEHLLLLFSPAFITCWRES